MRIISNFYDYYDKSVAYGVDPKLVYVRETTETIIKAGDSEYHKNTLVGLEEVMPRYGGLSGIIGFCGKVYPFYQFGGDCNCKFKKTYYSVDSIKNDLERGTLDLACKASEDIPYFKNSIISLRDFVENKQYSYSSRGRLPPEYFDDNCGKKISDDIFRTNHSPVILVQKQSNDWSFVVNPVLKGYNFITQYDPISAFQEISMYLGSTLVEQKDPNPKLSDEIKRDIHGFDKWSFRKQSKK